MIGADVRFKNSGTAWNPNQGMCNVLQQICCRGCEEKRQVFKQSFNISKCIGVDLSVVEGLYSALF